MRYNQKYKKAMKNGYDKLSTLNHDVFREELEKHKNGDIANIIFYTGSLDIIEIEIDQSEHNVLGGIRISKEIADTSDLLINDEASVGVATFEKYNLSPINTPSGSEVVNYYRSSIVNADDSDLVLLPA